MAQPLTIEKSPYGSGMDIVHVVGFSDEEIERLNVLSYADAIQEVVEIINRRNQGKAKEFQCGYGIYGMRIVGKDVYLTVGDSCD